MGGGPGGSEVSTEDGDISGISQGAASSLRTTRSGMVRGERLSAHPSQFGAHPLTHLGQNLSLPSGC